VAVPHASCMMQPIFTVLVMVYILRTISLLVVFVLGYSSSLNDTDNDVNDEYDEYMYPKRIKVKIIITMSLSILLLLLLLT